MAVVFKNNAKTTLASGLTSSATSVTVADGSAFPSLSGGDTFFCTFDNGTNVEVVKVTARSSNTLTIVRAQDDTTARAFSTGDVAELRLTAGILNLFSQTGVAITDEIEAYLDANGTTFPDNVKAQFGASNDLQIYHDGSNSYIAENGTGDLYLKATSLVLSNSAGANYLVAYNGGSVNLYHNANPKLATTSTGIDVTGVITTDGMTTSADINFGDDDKALFGASNDLKIYHSANNQSYIHEVGSGDLNILATNLKLQDAGGSTKVLVNSTGIDVTGTVVSDGLTVDRENLSGLKTWSNSDVGSIDFYQAASYPSTNQYGRVFDINSGSSNSVGGSTIRLLTAEGNGAGRQRLTVNNYGDISFYEDTGTTQALFWDASAERLGLGTSVPENPLHISASTEPYIRIENTDTTLTEGQVLGGLIFEQNDASGSGTGITGRIQMRSAVRTDNGSYFGNVADMDFLVSGASTGAASNNATKTALSIRAGTGNATFAGTISSGAITSTGKIETSGRFVSTAGISRFQGGIALGTDDDVYFYESSAGQATLRTGSSGAYKYFSSRTDGYFLAPNGYMVGSTVIVDGSRNLTNIGSISATDLLTQNNTTIANMGSRDLVTIGSGSRAGAIKINDVAGANYFIAGGGYDLTFYKNVSGTSNTAVMQFVGNNASDNTPDVSINHNLTVGGTITSSVNANRFFKYRSGSIADFEVSSDNNSNAVMTVTGTGTADIFKVRDNTTDVFTVADGGNATFAGTVTATGGNSTNWNTAYGWGNHASQSYATESYVGTQISNLVDSSPAALNTLNELAAALGDDANFSTTVNANIAAKLPLAGGTMTGTLAMGANAITSTGTISSGAITSSGNLHAGDGTNISMDSSANGQLEVDGNGYQGAIALDGSAMHIYHNSSSRSLVLGTNETARLTISGTGGFNFHSNNLTSVGTISSGAITSTGLNSTSGTVQFTDGSSSFDSSDANGYPRFTHTGGSAQIGLFRTSGSVGGMYIGGSADGFRVYTSGFAQKLLIDQSGNATFAGAISSGTITASDTSGSYGTAMNLTAGDTLSAGQGAKQIVMAFGSSSTVDYPHSIRTRHNSNAATGNNIEFWLWNQGTDSSSTVGTQRALVLESSTGLDLLTGGYKVSGTEVITSGRNLTNIGTISSGAITSTGAITLNGTLGTWSVDNQGAIMNFTRATANYIKAGSAGGYLVFQTNGANAALTLNSSQNATFAGTISSGAITSSGALTVTSSSTSSFNGTGYVNFSTNVGGVGVNGTQGLHIGWNKSNGGREINMIFDGGTTQAETEMIFTSTDGTNYSDIFQINGGGSVDIKNGGLRIGTTTVIDSSRNISNVNAISIGQDISVMDTTNLDLDIVNHASIRGASALYFGVTTNNYNSWKTRIGSDNTSTMSISGAATSINGSGYNTTVYGLFNSSGLQILGNTAWHAGNDGSGSGLDADTVDGKQATDLLHYRGIVAGDWDTMFTTGTGKTNTSGLYEVHNLASGHSNYPTGVYTYGSVLAWQLASSTFKLYSSHTGDLVFQSGWNNDEYSGWRRILNTSYYGAAWTSSNDGAGSGLDADLLDGVNSASFARVDASTTYTNYGNLQRFYSNTNMATASGSQASLECFSQGVGNDAFMTFHVGSDYAIYLGLDGGTNKLSTGGWSDGAVSHEIYHAGNKPSLATLGYTGATNANYITNNNQLTNGAAYTTQGTVNASNVTGLAITGLGTNNLSYGQTSGSLNGYTGWASHFIGNHGAGATYYMQDIIMPFWSSPKYSRREGSTTVVGPYDFWTSENDGSGSTLDADLLDGQEGAYYLTASNFTGTLNDDRLPSFVHLGTATTTGYATDDGGWGSRLNVSSNIHAKIEVSQEANSMRSHWYAHTGHDSIKFGTATSHDVEIQRGGTTRIEAQSDGANITGNFRVSGTTVIASDRSINCTTLTNTSGALLEIQNGTDGGSTRGIRMWTSTDANWGFYMGTAGAGKSFDGGTACSGLDGRTSHGIRYRVADSTTQIGHIFENANNEALFQIQPDTGNIFARGNVTAYASDARLKTNIQTIKNPIEKIKKIRGVEFDWIDNIEETHQFKPKCKRETGVIAQEIEAVMPDAISPAPFNNEYKTVEKDKIVALLIEAIKEQQKEIEYMKSEIKHLQENDNGDN